LLGLEELLDTLAFDVRRPKENMENTGVADGKGMAHLAKKGEKVATAVPPVALVTGHALNRQR